MEVLDPAILFPDQALLDAVRDSVNRGEGLNSEKDVELALLTLVGWPGYTCCLQWSRFVYYMAQLCVMV